MNLGIIRVAACTPKIKVANTSYNIEEILKCAVVADKANASVVLFPELAITGATCGDMFCQETLYNKNIEGLETIVKASSVLDIAIIVGFYLRIKGGLYNCSALIEKGHIKGITPKMYIPNPKVSAESRWFNSGLDRIKDTKIVILFGEKVPFGNMIFEDIENQIAIGMEIGSDMNCPVSPGTYLAINGTNIIFNPAASNETIGAAQKRRDTINQFTRTNTCGYVYTSSGVHESTTDLVFGGDSVISENGNLLCEKARFQRGSTILYGEIDTQILKSERNYSKNYGQFLQGFSNLQVTRVRISSLKNLDHKTDKIIRDYPKNPFVPTDLTLFTKNCEEIFDIQVAALAKRFEHSKAQSLVIGISGGLDSTLTLLVMAKAFRVLGRHPKDIIAVTMPGFGTTGHTYKNAIKLMELLGTTIREIPIADAVTSHFRDIKHPLEQRDITYENAQARERTQILMDIANKENGFVVGTGDLSEMALGWCTYNGDHMSMYGVNGGIPKTIVRHVVKWLTEYKLQGEDQYEGYSRDNEELIRILQEIVNTPISPELLPPDESGAMTQKTEDTVGPYELHDFFIYYTLRYGMTPEKILYLATKAFASEYDQEFIKKWLKVFYNRFFAQQYKRSCVPDGPKIGTVGLSPRGDLIMPSDVDSSIWLDNIK